MRELVFKGLYKADRSAEKGLGKMALTINTNIPSLIAQRNLDNATNALNRSMERMTTGYTINHASDNAAGYSISNMWVTQLGSLDVATDNAATGADMLTTAEETYSLLTSHLQRIRDLTEQAANGTYGTQSLRAIQSEIHARLLEINRISANAEFNGIQLMAGKVGANGIDLQVGLYANDPSRINLERGLFADASVGGLFSTMTTGATGTTSFTDLMIAGGSTAAKLNDTDPAELAKALEAFAAACAGMKYDGTKVVVQPTADKKPSRDMLQYIDAAINNISDRVTKIGSAQNRVSSAISALSVQSQNLTSSLSTLRDTDVAQESSKYLQAQILQQASATLLSTANQLPSVALNLI